MFISQKIYELIEKNGVTQRDVVRIIRGEEGNDRCGLNQIVNRDVRVSTLEKIADYFNVSMDYFFDREVEVSGVMVAGEGNQIRDITVNQRSEADVLRELIAEKDKRIELLEDVIDILRKREC